MATASDFHPRSHSSLSAVGAIQCVMLVPIIKRVRKKLPNQINSISYSSLSTSKRKKGYIRHLARRHADFYAVSQVSAKGAIITNARASGRSLLVDCDKSARMVLKRVSSSCDIRNKCVPISMQAYNSVCPGQYY